MTALSSVLIVDDEPAVRDLMARWVTSLGLRPKTAASADEALEALREQHCDLAVIDVMMPGHDGLWLATQLQRDHPHTAVVIATAYTDLLDGDSQQRPIADMLIKPFQRDRFALAVDRSERPGRTCHRRHRRPGPQRHRGRRPECPGDRAHARNNGPLRESQPLRAICWTRNAR